MPTSMVPDKLILTTLWAIKHIPTGKYLPQVKGRRGGSFTVPTCVGAATPRLMESEYVAKCVLASWLRGEVHPIRISNYLDDGWRLETVFKEDRIKSDMEIVKIILVAQDK